MAEKILCRVVIEVLGKPKEHVEKAMSEYIKRIKSDEKFNVLKEEFAELKKQESNLWATFTEMEMEVNEVRDLIGFCFDYMPSLVEIIKPGSLTLTDKDFSDFFNDLQAKLHQVDMIAKQVRFENEKVRGDMAKLLKNYVVILLGRGSMSLEQLSKFTGVKEEPLGDYMDKLLDEGLVKLEKDIYSLNREELNK